MLAKVFYPNSCLLFRNGEQISNGDVDYRDGLNAVVWDDNRKDELQRVVDDSTQMVVCGGKEVSSDLHLLI